MTSGGVCIIVPNPTLSAKTLREWGWALGMQKHIVIKNRDSKTESNFARGGENWSVLFKTTNSVHQFVVNDALNDWLFLGLLHWLSPGANLGFHLALETPGAGASSPDYPRPAAQCRYG